MKWAAILGLLVAAALGLWLLTGTVVVSLRALPWILPSNVNEHKDSPWLVQLT